MEPWGFSWSLEIGVLPLTILFPRPSQPTVGRCFYRFCGGRKYQMHRGHLYMRVQILSKQMAQKEMMGNGPTSKKWEELLCNITWKGIKGGACTHNFKASDFNSYWKGARMWTIPESYTRLQLQKDRYRDIYLFLFLPTLQLDSRHLIIFSKQIWFRINSEKTTCHN